MISVHSRTHQRVLLRCLAASPSHVLCVLAVLSVTAEPQPVPSEAGTLRQAAEARHILIGAAAASRYLEEADYASVLGSEFSQLQAENEMKFGVDSSSARF